MQNMSDNELDKLFKEAAEGFTPPEDTSAWKQMASMLDKAPIVTPGFWNWKSISTLTATGIIAVTATWFAVTNTEDKISKSTGQNGINSATQGVVQEQKEQPHPAGQGNLPPAQSLENKSSDVPAVTKANQKKDANLTDAEKSKNAESDRAKNEIISPETDNQFQGLEKSAPVVSVSSEADSQQNSNLIVPGISPVIIAEEKPIVASDSLNPAINEVRSDSLARDADAADKKDKTKSRGVISIKGTLSPDFSSVEFFSASKPGVNYGLLAGYAFNNRWSVYTGVISSRKLYATKDVEGSYDLDGHDYPIKELDGDCRIIDIPINVYYTFFPDRSFSLRAGLGFSSYIMRRENYVYRVDNYGDDAYYKQQVTGENNEWFKVMNVSVIVSKQFTSRFSAEFEPFVKAPLTGVGEGKVSLVSMGAFINLKYDLVIFK